jgi:hypothetical protein
MLLALHNNLVPAVIPPRNYLYPGGTELALWQEKENRRRQLRATLQYLYADENSLKGKLFKVIHKDFPDEEDLESLLVTLRRKMAFTPHLMTDTEIKQYSKAILAVEDLRKVPDEPGDEYEKLF